MTDKQIALYYVQFSDEEGLNQDCLVLAYDPDGALQLWARYFADDTENDPLGSWFEDNPMSSLKLGAPTDDLPEEPCLTIREYAFDLSHAHAIPWYDSPEAPIVAYALAGNDDFWASEAIDQAIDTLSAEVSAGD